MRMGIRAAPRECGRTIMFAILTRSVLHVGRLLGLVAVIALVSWVQACGLALAAPKGMVVEARWFQPKGWFWNTYWDPERDASALVAAFHAEVYNDHYREIMSRTGEVIELLEVPDDGEDAFSRWMQWHVLSRFDPRFRKRTPEERLEIFKKKEFDVPSCAEWYGFPFRGWEVRFDERNMGARWEMPILFGVDTGIRRTPRPWQWRWRWWLGESVEYAYGKQRIPNLVLPVVPRIPQALANGVFTLAAGWGVWWLVKRMRADRRELRGRCGGCGYPRPTGSAGPGGAGRESPQTCPECGCTARVVVRPLLGGRRFGVAWVRRG